MKSFVFMICGIVLTVLCWGSYGPVLHKGQAYLGNDRLKPLICVGASYFIVAIIIPTLFLAMWGKLQGGWTFLGVSWSIAAGTCGAFGALGIILALTNKGNPIFVMPLVFGGAPIMNVVVSMWFDKVSWKDAGPKLPLFLAGVIMVVVGASLVLICAPKKHKGEPHKEKPVAVAKARSGDTKPLSPSSDDQQKPTSSDDDSDAAARAADSPPSIDQS